MLFSNEPMTKPGPNKKPAPAPAKPKTKSADSAEKKENPDQPRHPPIPSHIALMLDVDGTLLDIAQRPQEVFVPKTLRETLARLQRRLDGAICFISGRPLEDLDRLFAPLQLPAVGGHGAEIRFPDDRVVRRTLRPFGLELKSQFYEIAKLGPGIIVEDKDFSIALHYRLAPQLGGQVMDAVADIWERAGKGALEILPGKSVVEVKPRGYDKGSGLREMMRHEPFTGRRPIFIGDDTTDHAAFAALPDFKGLGFSVGGIVAGASFNFDGPDDVRLWLNQLSRQAVMR